MAKHSLNMRFLVIDGYDEPGMAGLHAADATQAGVLYKKLLAQYVPEDSIDIIEISRTNPPNYNPDKYAGVCWTGSNLFFSESNPIVDRHIETCQMFFEKQIPQFGSCWAAQLAAVAAGGTVDSNPKGREFGMARKIWMTEEGHNHPMMQGRNPSFEGFTSHGDIITELPSGGVVLARNTFTPVQAIAVEHAGGHFWAVQYHPEYNIREIAALTRARKAGLIRQGSFRDEDHVASFVKDLEALHENPDRQDIAWTYGIDGDVLDPANKDIELKNWLSYFFGVDFT